MSIFIITDLHFNHKEQMKVYCGRPDNYEDLLFDGLAGLGNEDVLICLGDICIGEDLKVHQKYIEPLRCKKWLVRGNHDTKSDHWYLDHGWDMVCYKFQAKYYGKTILFSHMPQLYTKPIDLLYGAGAYDLNIHGHFHNTSHRSSEVAMKMVKNFRLRLLSMEVEGYHPISLQKFISKYENP